MTRYPAPVFCDECSKLALASLDGRLLCTECLLAALTGHDDWIDGIEPLLAEAAYPPAHNPIPPRPESSPPPFAE